MKRVRGATEQPLGTGSEYLVRLSLLCHGCSVKQSYGFIQKSLWSGRRALSRSREHECNVIGLLAGTDPIVDGGAYHFGDAGKRQVAIAAHQINQASFAKFSEIVLWFGYAVAVGDEDLARTKMDGAFLETEIVE